MKLAPKRDESIGGEVTHVASGMTVAVMKLEQSALRDSMGVRPARVPVT